MNNYARVLASSLNGFDHLTELLYDSAKMLEVANKEDLIAAQKKERKELLAKTQKMKHGVPKGDKKRKKEVLSEITQLLADLHSKHENEMKEFEKVVCLVEKSESINEKATQGNQEDWKDERDVAMLEDTQKPCSSNADDIDEGHIDKGDTEKDKVTQRISKAQKRRNKKEMMERERAKAIAEQEILSLSGLRHVESEKIKQKLSERNLTIFEVPSDGNCMYKAIEHQLSIHNLKEMNVQSLREETSKYMLSHMNDYLPFLTSSETGDCMTEAQYVKYCGDIANTSAWGGHIEIQVLSQICGSPIEVIQAEGKSIFAGDESKNPKLILSYHRHAYGLGEHYNSVVPVIK